MHRGIAESYPFKARAAVVNFQMHFCYSETATKDPQPICIQTKQVLIDAISMPNFKGPVKLRFGYCIARGRKGHGWVSMAFVILRLQCKNVGSQ